jgi:hypothetical protein
MFAEGDIADELGGEIDVATGGDLGQAALVAADHDFQASRGSLLHLAGTAGGGKAGSMRSGSSQVAPAKTPKVGRKPRLEAISIQIRPNQKGFVQKVSSGVTLTSKLPVS